VFFHGGGWVIGDLDSHDELWRILANRSGSIVVAVGYRLAPEHRFPAAVEDGCAVAGWEPACEIYFENCTIPADCIVGDPWTGFASLLRVSRWTARAGP
jgi:hypothetical protein